MLVEKFINVTSKQTKLDYIDAVWDMLVNSYRKVGGLKGIDREELLSDLFFWKIVWRKDHISAVSIYKKTNKSRKAVCAGTDGTPQGKSDLYMIMHEDAYMSDRHVWVEVSEAPEHMYKKSGLLPVPVDRAEKIMNNRGKKFISKSDDGYHYTRLIGGEPVEKVILGYDEGD